VCASSQVRHQRHTSTRSCCSLTSTVFTNLFDFNRFIKVAKLSCEGLVCFLVFTLTSLFFLTAACVAS
jgi:hypothetical protein